MRKNEEPIDRMLRWAEERGWNQTELAHKLRLESPQNVTNWKRRRHLPTEYHQSVADLFNRSIDELVGRVSEQATARAPWSLEQLPVSGTVQLGRQGYWNTAEHPLSGDGYIDMPSRDKDAYALRIIGDGLHPRVRSGEFIVVLPSRPPLPGRDALVVTKAGNAFVAEFLHAEGGQSVLQSLDPTHTRLTFQDSEIDHICRITGPVDDGTFLPASDLAQPGKKPP